MNTLRKNESSKDPTNSYIDENEYILSLERKLVPFSRKQCVIGWSLFKLSEYHLRSMFHVLRRFPEELYKARQYIPKTLKARGLGKNLVGLVIGNGPSQGLLSAADLDAFQSEGGVTICVNNCTRNEKIACHIPNWLVLSDPDQFADGEYSMLDFISQNPSMNILAPLPLLSLMSAHSCKNQMFWFADLELSIWRNIHPLYPRGYVSMTLYKALAWAIYMDFRKIGIIGMDNTYPRNLFNDINNAVISLETHAGTPDYVADMSLGFENIASYLDELTRLFHSLESFPKANIINLDPYSLTDRFRKSSIDAFFTDHLQSQYR